MKNHKVHELIDKNPRIKPSEIAKRLHSDWVEVRKIAWHGGYAWKCLKQKWAKS